MIHIIILTETWINSEDEAKRTQLPGYTHYFNYRQNVKGGGVSIFVHDSLKHNMIEEYTIDDNHYLWVHINKFCIDIGAIYKPGRTNHMNFLDQYSTQLEKRKRGIIFGDFNYDLLSSDRYVLNYKNMIKESGYYITNKIEHDYCTREANKSKTILDHVCTNIKHQPYHLAIIESCMSDHKQIYFELKNYEPEPLKSIKYVAINYEKLYNIIQNISENDKEDEYVKLEEKLLTSVEKSKTIKSKKCNPIKKDWINKEIIDMIDRRNKLWLEYRNNPTDTKIEEDFFIIKIKTAQMIQGRKSEYYCKSFRNCQNKPTKMWSLINTLCYNKTTVTAPVKLQTETGVITSVQEICEYFNEFFSTIGKNLANEIPSIYHRHNVFIGAKSIKSTLTQLTPTSKTELCKIIDNFNCNTSCGIDGISTKVIKCVKDLIIVQLTNCINKCLEIGSFPDNLKLAKVTPIFKSGSKTNPGNYRPISVLPVLSKIFERVLYNRLENYLNSNEILSNKQYGFRKKSNTLSATIDLITELKTNLDKKHIGLGIFIDLKKAFDTVSHTILLKKLENIGITGIALNMYKSYLSNRKQIVKIGNNKSQPKPVTYGVPQGSILGPLLFLIYINSIHEVGLKGNVTLYADDTCLFYFGHSIDAIITDAQNDLNLLHKWFQYNLLTINIAKTNYIIFKTKNKIIPDYNSLKINNVEINRTNHDKYLGLILDCNLNWKPHIDRIKNKLASLTGMLRGISRCFPQKVRYLIYNALVKPHIDYLIEVWGSASKTNLNTIQRAQNKVIKVLFRYNYLTPTDTLYKKTKLLNITQTYIYYTCLLVRKILTNNIHTQIKFTKKIDIQKMRLRNANNLVLWKVRTKNYGKKNLMYEGAQLYNKLPKDIKNSQSVYTFKRLLKHYLINK